MLFTTPAQIRLTRAPHCPADAFPQASRLPVWPVDGPSAGLSAPSDDATWARARGWTLSHAVAILAYYTPENNRTLYREAESWIGLALSGD
jgi:hypothetical protein